MERRDVVPRMHPDPAAPFPFAPPEVGDAAASRMGLIVGRFGSMVLASETNTTIGEERVFHLGPQPSAVLRALTIPDRDAAGQRIGQWTLFAVRSGPLEH